MKKTDTEKLEQLRHIFLEDRKGAAQAYWDTTQTLELYDSTFGRRIAWKWDAVWEELKELSWSPPAQATNVLDWGCGSAVASETLLNHFPDVQRLSWHVHDHSPQAMAFAESKLKSEFGLKYVSRGVPPLQSLPQTILLVSHVLTELDASTRESLSQLASRCAATVWVEPGTPFCSSQLVGIREQVRANKQIVAPCLHQKSCGLSMNSNTKDWCHFFAKPPREIFHDAQWANFSRVVGIDLRSLPVSFLAFETQERECADASDLARILGRARLQKGCARVCACRKTGVENEVLQKKNHGETISKIEHCAFKISY